MLPCVNILIQFSKKIVKDKNVSKIDEELQLLDPIFIPTPALALEQCKKVMGSMTDAALENYRLASSCLFQYKSENIEKIKENESFLDKTETVLGDYLVRITEQHLDAEQNRLATEFMHTVGDFERIGDHCQNLLDVAEFNLEQNIEFSEDALRELKYLQAAVDEALSVTVTAYQEEKESVCHKIGPLEDNVDYLVDMLKSKHIDRLKTGQCSTQGGISYVEILTNMERISDHCTNIAQHLHQRIVRQSLDTHRSEVFDRGSDEYKAMTAYYEKQFLDPVR